MPKKQQNQLRKDVQNNSCNHPPFFGDVTVKDLLPHVIEATILVGLVKGEDVFVPRIPMLSSNCIFMLKQLQLSVSLSFAISITMAKGKCQTLYQFTMAVNVATRLGRAYAMIESGQESA